MNRIDAGMATDPGNALEQLQEFDRGLLHTRQEVALYALLLSKAMDKNYIDSDSDSLIRKAVDYYESGNDSRRKAEALFYLGRVQYNASDDESAIITFYRAANEAEKTDDPILKGLAYLSLALTCNHSYNNEDELTYVRKSLGYFRESGDSYYIDNGMYYLAMSLHNNSRWHDAERVYDSLVTTPGVDSTIVGTAIVELANLCVEGADSVRKPAKAVALYQQAVSEGYPMSLQDWSKYAYALYLTGRKEQGRSIIRQLEEMDGPDSEAIFNSLYLINKMEGDYKAALDLMEKTKAFQEKKIVDRLRQNSARTMRDYLQFEAVRAEAKAERNRLVIIILVLSGGILAAIISFVLFRRDVRQKKERERLNGILEESKRMREDMFLKVEEQIKQNDSLAVKTAKMHYTLKKTFRAEFRELGDLAQGVISYGHKRDKDYVKEKLYSRIHEFAMSLTDDAKYKDFEKKVNRNLDNVMGKIRKDLPGLPEKHYKLLCLSIMGLDANYISMLLGNMSLDMVYRIKSDCRTHLLNLRGENQVLYEMLL